jgi:hypothetical protein
MKQMTEADKRLIEDVFSRFGQGIRSFCDKLDDATLRIINAAPLDNDAYCKEIETAVKELESFVEEIDKTMSSLELPDWLDEILNKS